MAIPIGKSGAARNGSRRADRMPKGLLRMSPSSRCARIGCWLSLLTLLVFLPSPARAGDERPTAGVEAQYAALLEPSLADDGRISPKERDAILRTARKLLTDDQMTELDRRIAPYLTTAVPIAGEATEPTPPDKGPSRRSGGDDVVILSVEASAPKPVGLFDAFSIGVGYNGSKDPQTLGIDAHNGGRLDANWAYPLLADWGIGIQAGVAANYERSAVRVLQAIDGTVEREEYFTTLGVFQRLDCGLSWGIAFDWLRENYFDDFSVSQWRAQAGYFVSENNEIGIWATTGDRGHVGSLAGVPFEFRAMEQYNVFWRHFWWHNIETKLWLGSAVSHSKTVFIFPTEAPARGQLTYGSEIFVPLSDRWALWGEANFVNPVSSGTVDAALGFAFYFGGRAEETRRDRFGPMFRVANNATFSVDVRP